MNKVVFNFYGEKAEVEVKDMTTKFIKWLCYLSLLLVSAITYAADESIVDANNSTDAIVNNAIVRFMKVNKVPGVAVELYVDGQPHSYNFGYANRDTGSPVTDNSIFEIGSVTKLFTTLLLAMEVNAGRMHLSDPLTKYIPELSNARGSITRITLENLATHTAGLPFDAPKRVTSENVIMNIVTRIRPPAAVGSQWYYSNFGLGLLGTAVARERNENYDQLYRNNILLPLGMSPIGINVPANLYANLAQGYDGAGVAEPYSPINALPGYWAMKATPRDMMKFLRASIGMPGTPPAILQAMRLSQQSFVATKGMLQGLGWQIRPLTFISRFTLLHSPSTSHIGPFPATQLAANERIFRADAMLDKTGSMDGFRSYIAVIPQQRAGIVLLVNRGVSNGTMMNTARYILFKTNHLGI